MSLVEHILCKSFFSFSRHPYAFTIVQLPKITFIFYTILRFSKNIYYRTFHFIPPNLNHKNNMDETFFAKYYIQLFQILFYKVDISLFHLIFFLFVYFHNIYNVFYLSCYQSLRFIKLKLQLLETPIIGIVISFYSIFFC